jgi:DHA1 family bicyclomycin/chloramphenicol resistance-like MFS transporter
MLAISIVNVVANFLFEPQAWWALLPIAVYAFGWALMVPVVTLLVLDLYPERRGLSSSLQAVIGSTANGLVAGAIAPLVMHSTRALAVSSILFLGIGLAAWLFLHRRWPQIGRAISAAA